MNDEDTRYLNLLSMFHYILGGITALFSCVPIIHVLVGLAMISGNFFQNDKVAAPPPFMGWIFVVMGTLGIVLGAIMAVCMMIAASRLRMRTARIYCMVIAAIECAFMPIGTVLGVFTLIVLTKDSVKQIFDQQTNTQEYRTSSKLQ